MKRSLSKLLAALLALSLLLSACGASVDTTPPEDPESTVGKGRYLEEALNLPEGIGMVPFFGQDDDGVLWVIGNDHSMGFGPYYLWSSSDGGYTWQREHNAWTDEFSLHRGRSIQIADFAPGGGFYIGYMEIDEEMIDYYLSGAGDLEEAESTDPLTVTGDGDSGDPSYAIASNTSEDGSTTLFFMPELGADHDVLGATDDVPDPQITTDTEPGGEDDSQGQEEDDWANYNEDSYFVRCDDDGIIPMPFDMPVSSDYSISPNGMLTLDSGDLLFVHYWSIMQVDGVSGEMKHEYEDDFGSLYYDNYAAMGDLLAVLQWDDNIALFDLNTGERRSSLFPDSEEGGDGNVIRTTNVQGGVLAAAEDGESFYYCNASGIFRAIVDGMVIERLLDGELTSLTLPSLTPTKLLPQANGDFLVLARDNEEYTLLRYHYDPDASVTPSTELKVYSLEENATIRQAIGTFQRQNSDVKISYSVGMTGEDGVTAADAMTKLSTELLAGTGPDILVLDGMSIDSYIQKQVLLDLSSIVNPKIQSGELMESVANTFRREDALYAVPARFTVPMINGYSDDVDAIHSLADFADWVESRNGDTTLIYNDGQAILRLFYNLCAPLWFDGDGSVNEAALTQSLDNILRISDNAKSLYPSDDELNASNFSFDLLHGAIMWASDNLSINIAELDSISNAAAPHGAIQKKGDGAFSIMENGVSGVYVPQIILGINTASSQTALAVRFLELALSSDVLVNNFNDGLPVNTTAIAENCVNPYVEGDDGIYYSIAMTSEDGITISGELQMGWPEEEFMMQLVDSFAALDTPSIPHLTIKQIILDECDALFGGRRSVADTVTSIQQKVDRYMSEQG